MSAVLLVLRLVLATVLAVAGAAKLADRPGGRAAVSGFGVPAPLAGPIAAALPLVELAAAVLLIPSLSARAGAALALLLLLAFSAAIARSIARGEAPECHCFGALHSEPAGPRTLARNLVLAAAAAVVLAGGPGASATAWLAGLDAGWVTALLLGLALAGAITGAATAGLRLLRRHGALLLRVDALESALIGAGLALPADEPVLEPAGGLPIGTPAPELALPGPDGARVSLTDLLAPGRDLLLVFSDPQCGPCTALAPAVSGWQRSAPGGLRTVVISRGDGAANARYAAEHRLDDLLVQTGREVDERFDVHATPSALVIGADGRIASAVHAGEDQIRALVAHHSAGPSAPPPRAPQPLAPPPLPALPIHRSAATVGGAAPDIVLRDLDGAPVALRDLLDDGAAHTIVFWNPGCGFCERMLDDLRAIDAVDPAGLIVISTGSVADNRALGLTSPVLLDDGFAAGRAFGAGGTPSAVAVDAAGRIGSPVAVGADAVLALAGAPVPA